ncbi:MAG: TIGR03960 family B12-binding radical SAM protein [Armatimonadetes bacterium]|nr:TIGR03960 family B12-binding radical SAM protein [Armatimonadota bacterium]
MEISDILYNVEKPARYIAQEWNVIKKKWNKAAVKVALVFPDNYEIAQSALGIKILYHLLNQDKNILAERVYAPALDLEKNLRDNKIALFSLENKRKLSEFDFLGFSLQHELTYTNILNILDLGKIPLKQKERGDNFPLICAGGPAVFNSEPIADFFDFIVLGEAEEVFLEIIEIYREFRSKKKLLKSSFLKEILKIKGIYVPSFYKAFYQGEKFKEIIPLKEYVPAVIHKRVIADLNQAYFPAKIIVPYLETIHDRITLEIFRGCTRGCRFCQAGAIYRPLRERSLEKLRAIYQESYASTGYDEISLSSLSCTDYTQIIPLIKFIKEDLGKINISLPSLRVDQFNPELADLLKGDRKGSLTFALEAGSQRLRDLINKGTKEENILSSLGLVKEMGIKKVKLYFMLGLPTENKEDLEEIVDLIRKILKNTGLYLKISIAAFIPKTHTAFQWQRQNSLKEIEDKITYLKKRLKHPKIKLNFHIPQMSILEGIFARGDRLLGEVILKAWEKGARFDSYLEYFNWENWLNCFQDLKINFNKYLNFNEENLPWGHLNSGMDLNFLKEENSLADKEKIRLDCRVSCSQCGVCENLKVKNILQKKENILPSKNQPDKSRQNQSLSLQRIRIKYKKNHPINFISHLDLIRVFKRALQRANLPVSYTNGIHPRMRLNFSYPLPIGATSQTEYLDLEFDKKYFLKELNEKISSQLPEGLKISKIKEISINGKNLISLIERIIYQITFKSSLEKEDLKEKIFLLKQNREILIERKGKLINLVSSIYDLKLINFKSDKIKILLDLLINPKGIIKPKEVIYLLDKEAKILKTKRLKFCFIKNE